MPAGLDPYCPRNYGVFTIQSQTTNGGATDCRQADHPSSFARPLKVVVPEVRSRMIQGCLASCFRIRSGDESELEAIATLTGKAKIIRCRLSTGRQGNNMVYFERHDYALLRVAIFTAFVGALFNELS